jgi:hypothetical protein
MGTFSDIMPPENKKGHYYERGEERKLALFSSGDSLYSSDREIFNQMIFCQLLLKHYNYL